MKKFGIVSRAFNERSAAEAAELMSANGMNCTELCMSHTDFPGWVYNGISKYRENNITKETVKEKAGIFRDSGIEVTAFGVFSNLLEPDDSLRENVISSFVELMDYAAYSGIPNVTTELGFRADARGLLADNYESDFARLVDSFSRLGREAHDRNITLCVETCVIDVIPSAKRTRDFLRQVEEASGVKSVKVLLDMANLIANSDEDDVFKYLADDIVYAHGKDRKVNDRSGRNFGDGDIDWAKYFINHNKFTPDAPFILEYCNESNFRETAAKVRAYKEF
ncbi:hypothetical protein FACS1894105_07570 [Clostridia bacterium]|nr:hypothetical protein FACS1894105_07570 [Clostridia bacterium]